MIPAYSLRHLRISPGLILAPMSGVTTKAFRRLIRELNPDAVGLVISEFISVEGLTRGSTRSEEMMRYHECERPFGIQIFGYDIERMCRAAQMVEQSGADLVDINCGCPAPKVVKNGGGCELMRQPGHLKKMFSAVRACVRIPLTMKMRSGWDSESLNALEVSKIAESEGVEAIAIHGRTRVQLYRGKADWEVVKAVAAAVKIPVLGSGDVTDAVSAEERLSSGARGLLIGRAALENPYVFSEVLGLRSRALYGEDEVVKILQRYIELLLEDFPAQACVGRVKQLASQLCRGLSLRKALCTAMTLQEQLQLLKRIEEGAPITIAA